MHNARLIDANSAFEWRLAPDRLDGELVDFLERLAAEDTAFADAA